MTFIVMITITKSVCLMCQYATFWLVIDSVCQQPVLYH